MNTNEIHDEDILFPEEGDVAPLDERVLVPDVTGVRLDVFLAEAGIGLSRNQAQRLIDDGLVSVSGRQRAANYRLRPSETVKALIPPPKPTLALPEDIPLDILYEDESLVVVDKPAGLVVHPAAGNRTGTLVNALLFRCGRLSSIGGELRPGIVHRLDKDTSGVIVVAKTDPAHVALANAFKEHTNVREYVAVVMGNVKSDEGAVAVAIGRHVTDRKKMSPTTFQGRNALTRYTVVERFGAATLIALRLATGRTHQIRVHMAHIGHPVAGDTVYGGDRALKARGMKVSRQMLHARLLGFVHPVTGEAVEFSSPIPADMVRLIEFLRQTKTPR